jgi:plastocyanin
MIHANLRRLFLPMILGAVAWTSYGVGLAPTFGVHDVFAASKSPVKVLAKEVNHKYVFGPTKVTIKVGQTVLWKNPTSAPHTVTSTTAGWTYDKKLNIGKSLQLTFKKAGTFHYKCSYHPGMVGTVIVSH